MGDGKTTVGHQVMEQIEFFGRQVYGLVSLADNAAGGVQFNVVDNDCPGDLKQARRGAPDGRSDSGRQFGNGERFCDIIISACTMLLLCGLVAWAP
jgi:hypothetical protein